MILLPRRWLPGRHVDIADPRAVTTTNTTAEVEPRAVGLTSAAVAAIWASVVTLYETGLHPALALTLRRHGKVVLDRALGHAKGASPVDPEGAPKVLATPSTLFNFFSASKAVTAMVIHHLDERGLLHLDDAVVEYVPEFGRHGKDRATLRHLLTHRAGIPVLRGVPVDVELLADERRILELLCDAEPVSVPGRRLAYHAITGGFVLGEVVRRVTGKGLREVLAEAFLKPLGFAHFNYGVSPALADSVAVNAFTGLRPPAPMDALLRRSLGVGAVQAAELSNARPYVTGVVPSGNIIGTADEGCRFFEMLLREGALGGERVLEARTVRRAIAEQTYLEMDSFLGLPVRYGMGFMLGGDTFSIYGSNTGRAFGHVGFTNIIAWADPDRDLSACLMCSGKPFVTPGQLAWLGVMRTIADRVPRG
ncbi:MAG: beta-lactamase family protein [Deltaproteobacteria bacterium]|nr:beta-lactamase family protein [Deltaproteobacteria bacterium]